MQCESCQKNVATVHLTDVSNNKKRQIHLCEDCAKGQGVTIKSYMHKEPSYQEFVSQLVESQADHPLAESDLKCSKCGLTYRRFRSTGKFGCPHDYVVFKKGLLGLLEKIHSKVQHTGKVPLRASDQIARQKELRTLRAELEKAIRGEAYEKAAEIRDKIYRMEGRERASDHGNQ